MALKAGYYGVKKKILDELRKLDGILPAGVSKDNKLATQSEIENVWAGNAITGVHQLLDTDFNSAPGTITVASLENGVITLSGEQAVDDNWPLKSRSRTGKYIYLPKGSYKFQCIGCDTVLVGTTYNSAYKSFGSGKTVEFTIDDDTQSDLKQSDGSVLVGLFVQVKKGTYDNVKWYPLLTVAGDIDNSFGSYAMTNQQLTASASDQKTAINAIIAAATDAADFTAFKTAMGAITPVTRSLSIQEPETRSLDPEPEPETKTTKRSTKKTETSE